MKKETIKSLEVILASSYGLALKTQNYHWNVTGANFKSLHELFGAQYEELSEAIDDLAERIRALGDKVEGTFDNFSKLSKIKAGDKKLNSNDMLKDLVSGHEAVVKLLNAGIKISQKEGDEATADMLIGRIEAHDKAAWMLRSSIA
jgi:starvation-inducible DNA-binding protein